MLFVNTIMLVLALRGTELPSDFASNIEYQARTQNGRAIIYAH
jgi:hypothetical protein